MSRLPVAAAHTAEHTGFRPVHVQRALQRPKCAENSHQKLCSSPIGQARRRCCCRTAAGMQHSTASQVLASVAQLPQRYRGALLDQFGVLHDGQKPYPGAVEAVAQLAGRGMRLLIISNSSRREEPPPLCRDQDSACRPNPALRSAACAGALHNAPGQAARPPCVGPCCRLGGRPRQPGAHGL